MSARKPFGAEREPLTRLSTRRLKCAQGMYSRAWQWGRARLQDGNERGDAKGWMLWRCKSLFFQSATLKSDQRHSYNCNHALTDSSYGIYASHKPMEVLYRCIGIPHPTSVQAYHTSVPYKRTHVPCQRTSAPYHRTSVPHHRTVPCTQAVSTKGPYSYFEFR